jgi:hypothetical protein
MTLWPSGYECVATMREEWSILASDRELGVRVVNSMNILF